MKLLIFTFVSFILISKSFSNDFLEKLRSGELKRDYPESDKSENTNFLKNLRSGKIKRNYPKNSRKNDPKFLQKLRSGEISREYNQGSKPQKNNESQQEGSDYRKRGKVFVDEINLDHMLKNKEKFSKENSY